MYTSKMRWARWLAIAVSLTFWACDNSNTSPPTPGEVINPDGMGRLPATPPPTSTIAPGLNREIFPALGETAFMTANERELLSAGVGNFRGNARGELDDFAAEDADGDGVAEGGAQDPNAPPGEVEAQPDVERAIVEADVFKLDGDLLYVLNRYRGIVIIDVSDPQALRIRGRLPFQSSPVEMYVREGRAYVISSDYFTYWQYDPEADPHGFHGSEVMIIDVENPDQPEMMGRLSVDGEITDTRMVGDVLYSISKRRPNYWRYNTADWEDRTWIVSLDISDPADIKEVDRITFQGMSTLIHVAHHAIFVAAWDPNFYLTDPDHEQETLITYVDISDPAGDLRERGKVYIPGRIRDKFKMDWFEGKLRVFSQVWRGDADIQLHTIETEFPDDLEIDHTLDLEGLSRSGLQATRFDGERAFAMSQYYLRARRGPVRELHSIDLSSGRPVHSDTLEINVNISHFEIHGERLLALGRHYTQNSSRTALALYNISDLENLSSIAVEPLGVRYSGSEANGDYKALKTFPELNLILVPLNFWSRNESFQGVALVDWDADSLVERGRVANKGGVRRAFPVGDNQLIAVGEWSIATIDATDRDEPQVTDRLNLVRVVHDVFDIGGKQVQLISDPYAANQIRLEVREFGMTDDSTPLASLELPFNYAPYVLHDGDALHLLGWERDRGQVIRNADLSEILAPRLRGDLQLTNEHQRIHNQGFSFYAQYWSPHAGLPLRNQILPVTVRRIIETESGRRDFDSQLEFIDLRDLDNPRVAEGSIPMNDYPFVNKVTHGEVLFSGHVEQATTEQGDSLLYHVRSFVDRIDVSDPDAPVALPSLNVPGYLVDTSDNGELIYTIDFQWDDFGRRRNSLNVLKVQADDTALLIEVIPINDQLRRAALRPGWISENGGANPGWHDRTIWLTAHKYPWWGVRSDTVDSRQPYTVLRRLDFDEGGHLETQLSSTLKGYHFDLLDIDGERAYLGSRGPYGVLVLNIQNAAEPVIEYASRTIGYLSRIVTHDGRIYAPMGHFGLREY